MKTKILAIVPSGFCFGLQNLTLSFFRELSTKTETHFLNTRWNDGEFPRRVEELGLGQSFTWLGMFSRALNASNLKMTTLCLIKLPLAWWHFLQLYRRFRPNVVYLANYHELILLWPLLVFFRRKVVCHMHDPPPAIPFQRASFAMWRLAVGRFLFISKNVKERMARLGRLDMDDAVIHNGVEVHPLVLPRFRSDLFVERFVWSRDVVIIGMTGQMIKRKGHEDFLEAARLAVLRNARLRFVIGGKAIEPFNSELRRWITTAELGRFIAFSGWVPKVQDFYEAIDIFVLPSRHDEGFGLVVAEAMERGCPVIATRSGGTAEIIEDGISGYLVEKEATQEIAERILMLAVDRDLIAHFAEAGRERVVTSFNRETQVRAFENLLTQCDLKPVF